MHRYQNLDTSSTRYQVDTKQIELHAPVPWCVGGPRAYQDQFLKFVGASPSECMLVGSFSCIKN